MSVLGQAALGAVALGASKAAASSALTVQAVPASTTFNAGTLAVSEQVQSVPGNVTYNTGATTGAIAPTTTAGLTTFSVSQQSLQESVIPSAALATFSSLVTASQQINTVPASITYSVPVVGVAIAPKPTTAGLTTFSSGTNKLGESVNAIPGNFVASIPNLSGVFVVNSIVNSVVFSNGTNNAAFNVVSNASTTTFNSGTQKLSEIATTTPGHVQYSSNASLAGNVIVQSVPANTTFSIPVATLARAVQTVPGNVAYSSLASLTEIATTVPATVVMNTPTISLARVISGGPGSTSWPTTNNSLAMALKGLATATYSGSATVREIISTAAASTSFTIPPLPVGLFLNSTPGNVVFDIGLVDAWFQKPDIPGSIFVTVTKNTINVQERFNQIDVVAIKSPIEVEVELNKSDIVVEHNQLFVES